MAGVFRKTMEYLGLMEPGEEEYDNEFLPDEEPETAASVRPLASAEATRVRRYPEPVPSSQRGSLALENDIRVRRDPEPSLPAEPTYRITTLMPTSYNDAKEIGEQFRSGIPVIMNLTDMETSDAKRLVDFAVGLTFGLHGRLDKVTNKVFMLSPSNVEVSDADMARIREGGFFNQS
jgi:cell division inhibitor SepF